MAKQNTLFRGTNALKTYVVRTLREIFADPTIVLDDRLGEENYLYLEGVVGLAKAMMDKDAEAAQAYMKLLFGGITIDGVVVDEAVLEDLLKKGDSVGFALSAVLKFRPVVKIDPEELDRYKLMVENALMAA